MTEINDDDSPAYIEKNPTKSKSPWKKGAISKKEDAFIRENYLKMNVTQIGEALNRRKDVVQRYIIKNKSRFEKKKDEFVEESIKRIELSMAWKNLKKQLDEDEFLYAKELFEEMVKQFKEDVLKTEENQIIKAILYQIFMSRNSIERKEQRDEMAKLKRNKDDLLKQINDPRNKKNQSTLLDQLATCNTMIQAILASEQSLTSEYVKFEKQHQELMVGLKATREQRINKIEGNKRSWLEIIKSLELEEVREKEGRQNELMKIATQKELDRLSKPHLFLNKEFDVPVLNVQTLESGEKKENEIDGK